MKNCICPKTAFDWTMKAIQMPFSLIMLLAVSCSMISSHAAEPSGAAKKTAPAVRATSHAPWLGFEVCRADDAVRAQLPKLPKGVGFIINKIDPQGPADRAGLRALDILWKWNDQWLINEAQLSTLLDMQQAGDRVTLVVYRAGKEQSHVVTLGQAPPQPSKTPPRSFHSPRKIAAIAFADRMLPQDLKSRTARLEDAQAVLEMEKRDDGIWLSIVDTEGVTIYDGPYSSSAKGDIPLIWQDRVDALQRSLQKSSNSADTPLSPENRATPRLPEAIDPRRP
jgi:hypothetical protein